MYFGMKSDLPAPTAPAIKTTAEMMPDPDETFVSFEEVASGLLDSDPPGTSLDLRGIVTDFVIEDLFYRGLNLRTVPENLLFTVQEIMEQAILRWEARKD